MKTKAVRFFKPFALGRVIAVSFLASNIVALNVHAGDLRLEQKLGRLLYSDISLSLGKNQSCETCHSLEKIKLADGTKLPSPGFVDPVNVTTRAITSAGSVSGKFGGLNAPSAGYAAFSPTRYYDDAEGLWIGGQFWNGRAKTLEDQAKGPFLNPAEMAMPSRWAVISEIKKNVDYVQMFNRVYGVNLNDIPSNLLAESDDTAPDLVYVAYDRVASAIAAFERSSTFNKFNSKFDAVQAGIATFTQQEEAGMVLFAGKAQCALCHVMEPAVGPDGKLYPPVFTDFTYDNIGVPRTTAIHGNPQPDIGLGATTGDAGDNGKHKVMSLRNIEMTAPYGHNGYFLSLEHIVHFYNTRDVPEEGWAVPEVGENVNHSELGDLQLTREEEGAVVAFLKTLTDGYFNNGN